MSVQSFRRGLNILSIYGTYTGIQWYTNLPKSCALSILALKPRQTLQGSNQWSHQGQTYHPIPGTDRGGLPIRWESQKSHLFFWFSMLFHGGHKQKKRFSKVNLITQIWCQSKFTSWSTLCWCFRLGGDVGPICWYVTAFDICFKMERLVFRQFVCTQSASILPQPMQVPHTLVQEEITEVQETGVWRRKTHTFTYQRGLQWEIF